MEFKLCKLLLRKLLDNSRMTQSRLGVRGYSQADSLPPVLPPCSSTPAGHVSLASWPRKGSGQHHKRPIGSACSLPAMMSKALETRLKLLEGPPNSEMNGNNFKQVEGQDSCTGNTPFSFGAVRSNAHALVHALSSRHITIHIYRALI